MSGQLLFAARLMRRRLKGLAASIISFGRLPVFARSSFQFQHGWRPATINSKAMVSTGTWFIKRVQMKSTTQRLKNILKRRYRRRFAPFDESPCRAPEHHTEILTIPGIPTREQKRVKGIDK
jgi:hypothetical protein